MKFCLYLAPDQDQAGEEDLLQGLEEVMAESEVIEIVDEETGESYLFYLVDEFDFKDNLYSVLMTQEEPYEYIIARVDMEDDESYLVSLEEDEEDAVYDYYEEILDKAMEEEAED